VILGPVGEVGLGAATAKWLPTSAPRQAVCINFLVNFLLLHLLPQCDSQLLLGQLYLLNGPFTGWRAAAACAAACSVRLRLRGGQEGFLIATGSGLRRQRDEATLLKFGQLSMTPCSCCWLLGLQLGYSRG